MLPVVAAYELVREWDLQVWVRAPQAEAEGQEERGIARVDRRVREAHHL